MGVLCNDDYQTKRDKLKKLQNLLNSEIKNKEKEIREVQEDLKLIEIEIKKLEKVIKNLPKDDESQRDSKIQKLKDYLYEKERKKIKLKYLDSFNQILKDNLNNIEIKLMKLKNKENLERINTLINDVGDVSTKEDLENNINILLKEKKNDNEEIQILESGNRVLNPEIETKIDEYIKNLLST